MNDYQLTSSDDELDQLERCLDGRLVRQWDPEFHRARQAWNLAADQDPEAVIYAASVRDVVSTVRAAQSAGLQVAPQSSGHSAAPLGNLAGAVLLRMDDLHRVEIDADRQTAHVEGGARWHHVTGPAALHGLAALAGSSSSVGVAGYTLGGGISWLARSHGLAANSIISFDVVTADGEHRTAGPDADADLFWALRGGGGDFGIVTALEFRLYPVREVYAGTLLFPISRTSEVLPAWRSWSSSVPESVTSLCRVLRFPPLEDGPEHLRGQNFVGIEAACQLVPEDADRLLAPLRAFKPVQDTFAVIGTADLAWLHMDPVDPTPCIGDGALLSALPAEALDALIEVITSKTADPLMSFELRHLGGMLAPGRMEGGAVSALQAEFAAYTVGFAPTRASVELVASAAAAVLEILKPWTSGSYLNFAEQPTDTYALFGSSWDRLAAIKSAYDPTDLIRSNHPVRRSKGESSRS